MPNARSDKNKEGQALLFAVVAVTIALAIGVSSASKNISSISRVTRTDSATKAYAAAEGGLERLLKLPDTSLGLMAVADPPCTDPALGFEETDEASFCRVTLEPSASSQITTYANIKVEKFNYNLPAASSRYGYTFNVAQGTTKEVVLYESDAAGGKWPGGTMKICLQNENAAIYYYAYSTKGVVWKGILIPNKSPENDLAEANTDTFSLTDSSITTLKGDTYSYCNNYEFPASTSAGNPYGLRITALYASTEVAVFPDDANVKLPTLGYKLTAKGRLEKDGKITETKVVVVYRSLPFMPQFVSSAIFNAGGPVN